MNFSSSEDCDLKKILGWLLESVKYKLIGRYSVDYWIDDYRVGVVEEFWG